MAENSGVDEVANDEVALNDITEIDYRDDRLPKLLLNLSQLRAILIPLLIIKKR